ncbi:30S ribosomal protein S9 [Candidatus Uhrbacteria bacterium]|nr:30S ribosomal protein S9 [Candidatus Uhrbacteria bacterium]
MEVSTSKYIEALGRRKAAIARVRMTHGGTGKIVINGRGLEKYLPLITLRDSVQAPLKETGMEGAFDISVKVEGGGARGQADSIRLGIARGLLNFNPEFRSVLKKLGMLTRDARVRERKKPGKKSARRSPQWSKR